MRLKLRRRFWTIESKFFQSASSLSPPCRRSSSIENPPLRWFWWIFFQWILPRGICFLQFIKVLNLRIIDIFFFSLVVKFVEHLSKNFIALYLHWFLKSLELFFLNESSFHTLSMYAIKSYENEVEHLKKCILQLRNL